MQGENPANDGLLLISVKDRPRLLLEMMHALRGEGTKVSLEGYLADAELVALPGASTEETTVLKRATLSPRLDFLVLPLDEKTEPSIAKAIRSRIPFKDGRGIIHAQIEGGGEIIFAAYDSFHHCHVKRSAIAPALVSHLTEKRNLRASQ
jgi:hypothetical protein